ncbi:unnamed protein product, partial [Rotaria sordida]
NDEIIHQLELKLQKLEESIKKYERFLDETKTEIENLDKDMTVKTQAASLSTIN